ncbi:MAG: hypothetical protein JW833_07300, partial [Prolixibacteraceae bacterium]|nr:hypothetical protein [Prolixibacteraceae bacterium]
NKNLGKIILGDNSILDSSVEGFVGKMVYNIGPINNNNPKLFFNNGTLEHVLNCFYSYFVPMEFDVETNLIFNEEQESFILNNVSGMTNSYLGYGTVL